LKKLPTENNLPTGENSANPVTLTTGQNNLPGRNKLLHYRNPSQAGPQKIEFEKSGKFSKHSNKFYSFFWLFSF
jgi:hypothetical protein